MRIMAPACGCKYLFRLPTTNYMMTKSSIPVMQKIAITVMLSLLNACAQFETEPVPVPECYTPPRVQSDLEKLLAFGAGMAHMPPSARVEVCESLLKRQKELPDNMIRLQLMLARSLSDACGDVHRVLEQVESIPVESLQDEALRQYVAVQKESMKTMQTVAKKLGTLERKQKKFQSVLDSKESVEPKANETRLLREKLEAIRTMEKQLDESSDAKQ